MLTPTSVFIIYSHIHTRKVVYFVFYAPLHQLTLLHYQLLHLLNTISCIWSAPKTLVQLPYGYQTFYHLNTEFARWSFAWGLFRTMEYKLAQAFILWYLCQFYFLFWYFVIYCLNESTINVSPQKIKSSKKISKFAYVGYKFLSNLFQIFSHQSVAVVVVANAVCPKYIYS